MQALLLELYFWLPLLPSSLICFICKTERVLTTPRVAMGAK